MVGSPRTSPPSSSSPSSTKAWAANQNPAGLDGWVAALAGGMTKAQVAQAFMESAENQQNSDGFVTGWGALRAAGNPGPTTAQLEAFSDTATTAQIIASADAVGDSTTIRPTGPGATPYDLTDTAANLAAAEAWELNGATNITATDAATVEQAAIIEAASNTGTTTYDINDTAAHLAASTSAVLALAGTVTASTLATATQATAIAAFGTPVTYSVSDTAANIAAASTAARNEAVNLTATTSATVVEATAIDAAANTGTNTYNITDTAAAVGERRFNGIERRDQHRSHWQCHGRASDDHRGGN